MVKQITNLKQRKMKQNEQLETAIVAMNKLMYYAMNYDDELIGAISDGEAEQSHYEQKFTRLYQVYGPNSVVVRFYLTLDDTHRRRMLQYIYDNYNNEQQI